MINKQAQQVLDSSDPQSSQVMRAVRRESRRRILLAGDTDLAASSLNDFFALEVLADEHGTEIPGPKLREVDGVALVGTELEVLITAAARAREERRDIPIAIISSRYPTQSLLFCMIRHGVTFFSLGEFQAAPVGAISILGEYWPDARWVSEFCSRWRFSPREGLIFASACAGMSKTDVAEELQCSVRTVDTHWNRIFGKMGVRSAQGVLAAALREVLCPQARIAFGAIRFSAMSPSYFPASQVAR